ncbi:hypothetical protein Q9R19_03875 [Microbacterium sp. ARD32]|uniref:hypothetical protein n=1 Tax=Microbacterium sp. ARD32 TaxID=2962577 RepID=UPI002881CA5B|nr:hypothetical protein [Microbacterium sp. ARD32]MDT0156760.1 hypothetical protein [Microbacterium sp. ARD32]
MLLLLMTAGCGSVDLEPIGSGRSLTTEALERTDTLEVSRIKDYEEIRQLEMDSDLVIVAAVSEDRHLTQLNGTPVTERVVRVLRTLKGDPPAEVVISELGDGAGALALQPRTTHLLFLTEYELQRGVPTGQFVVTGVYAGDYEQAADGSFVAVDPESLRLPRTLEKDFSL